MEEKSKEEQKTEDLTSLWHESFKEQVKEKEEEKQDITPEIEEKLMKFLDLPLLVEVVVGSTKLTLGEILIRSEDNRHNNKRGKGQKGPLVLTCYVVRHRGCGY